MKHLTRLSLFFSLMMAFAFAASAQAVEEENKSTGKQITKKKQQASHRTVHSHYNSLWIHNTWLDYEIDEDGDGFYHHFRFSFDADTRYASQALIAEVYLTDGYNEWEIFTSNTFWIHGQSGTDVYEVATALNEGYPAQTYDLVLRLYDATSYELLEEWTYLDDSNLANLFLEDASNDTTYSSTPYVHSFELDLNDDFDNDGYFSQIHVSIDVDSPNSHSDIRIGIDIYDPIAGWQSLYLSNEIAVSGNSMADQQNFTIDLDQGYPEGNYTLRITLYESLSRATLATQAIEQQLPLESLDYENEDDEHEHRANTSHGHGGSLGLMALPLIALGCLRKRR